MSFFQCIGRSISFIINELFNDAGSVAGAERDILLGIDTGEEMAFVLETVGKRSVVLIEFESKLLGAYSSGL